MDLQINRNDPSLDKVSVDACLIRFEPISYMLETGLNEIVHEWWMELEAWKQNSSYTPNWDAYKCMEERNEFRAVSLRKDNHLVGYAGLRIGSDIHFEHDVIVRISDCYITPKYRGYAPRFFKFIQKELMQIGVTKLVTAERLDMLDIGSTGKFYEKMGFKHLEVIWYKTLGNA